MSADRDYDIRNWNESDQTAILIFDRDAATVRLAQHFLTADGYRVYAAGTLEEAFRLNDAHKPWIVIASGSFRAGEDDGWRFVSDARRPGSERHHPASAIMLTPGAHDGPLPVDAGFATDLFLAKPLNPRIKPVCPPPSPE